MSAETIHLPAGRPGAAQSRNRIVGALFGACAVLPAALWLWGFSVDDALITARVGANIARGMGSRFNPHGAPVDAVTPLGYGQLLALVGGGQTLVTFESAKRLGLAAWLVAAALLGRLMVAAGQSSRRFSPFAIVALSAPLAAWSVSGMETGLVTLLCTLGVLPGSASALALGAAAAWRPELVPFAITLATVRARHDHALRLAAQAGLVLAPVLLVALIRQALFGRAVPLAFYAKPSDFAHGLRYALGACAFTGLPWLLVATPAAWRRCPPQVRPLLAALVAHFLALVLCGGDWMPLYRLAVPVLPCAALAAAYLADQACALLSCARLGLGLASALLLALGLGPAARRVGGDRARLIAAARPVLALDARVAALDVGWVGAASDADVIDFAGVTDPQVAFFPGGHTSKRIPRAWLLARQPTAVLLLLAPGERLHTPFERSVFSRSVERRVALLEASELRVRTTLDLAGQTYVVLEPLAEH